MCIASRYVHWNEQEACKHAHVHDCTLKIWKWTFLKNMFSSAPPPS